MCGVLGHEPTGPTANTVLCSVFVETSMAIGKLIMIISHTHRLATDLTYVHTYFQLL